MDTDENHQWADVHGTAETRYTATSCLPPVKVHRQHVNERTWPDLTQRPGCGWEDPGLTHIAALLQFPLALWPVR